MCSDIVVHELMHVLEPMYSPRFISLMDLHMPKWQFYGVELNRLPVGLETLKSKLGLSPRKSHDWRERYGRANEHKALVQRDHCITPHERKDIINFAGEYPLEGYRHLTFMMLDRDLVAVSSSTTCRVLKDAGLLQPWNTKPTKKGTACVKPIEPHDHWQVDFSYINIAGTFYGLCSVLDGCSRAMLS